MASKQTIAKCVAILGTAFPKDIPVGLLDVWTLALADVADADLERATLTAIQTSEFFPSIKAIRDAAGVNAKSLPGTAGILTRLRGMMGFHEEMPSVERVREELGDAIANAYGFVGPKRLEAVVLDGEGVGADIASREFATALRNAQESGQSVTLPPLSEVKRLSNARQSLFIDGEPPKRIGQHIAGLLPQVAP